MTVFLPQYRFEIRGPRSLDPTEATVLTPIAGAAHADPFRVTTEAGVAGWQPYLGPIRGRRGRIDPLSKQTDVGTLTVPVLEKRAGVPSEYLKRWVTTFIGSVAGVSRFIGLKARLWENLGDGAGYQVFWTGRITAAAIRDGLWFEFTLSDMMADMHLPVFIGEPSAAITDYSVQRPSLLPVGLIKPYGNFPVSQKVTAVVANSTTRMVGGVAYIFADLIFTGATKFRTDNRVTEEFFQAAFRVSGGGLKVARETTATARVRVRVSSSSAGSTGDFVLRDFANDSVAGAPNQAFLSGLTISELTRPATTSAAPPGYLAMPPDGATVQLYCVLDGPAGYGGSRPKGFDGVETPVADVAGTIVINDVHPLRLLRDMLAGYYGYLWKYGEQIPAGVAVGDPKRAIPYSTAQFSTASPNALINDLTFPLQRFIITKRDRLDQWAVKAILQPNQLGLYMSAAGEATPVDLRRPTTLPSLTIADADLDDTGAPPAWSQDRASAVTRVIAKSYQDWPLGAVDSRINVAQFPVAQRAEGMGFPSMAGFFQIAVDELELLDIGNSDTDEREITIDALGFRGSPNEQLNGQDRATQLRQLLSGLIQNLQQPYGSGAQLIVLECRRTANASTCQPGDLRLIACTALPDPASNLRGGTRLARCVERSEEGLRLRLVFVDLGVNTTATAPTLGIVSQSTGDPVNSAQCDVTLASTASPVEVRYAATTGGSTSGPASSDPGWTFAEIVLASRTVTRARIPAGRRVFFQGRTLPGNANPLQMPSSWVAASSNGYVDLAALPGPTGFAAAVSAAQARLTWTPGSTVYATEVRLSQPSTGLEFAIARVQAGQRQLDIGLLQNTSYGGYVYHTDGIGGYSTGSSGSFSSTGAAARVCPDMLAVVVLKGGV